MRTLVYKRTHRGDPDSSGRFGCNDCMGRVRSWDFEAVIGVGGRGREARESGLAGKVNWIGIKAHKTYVRGMADPIVTFDHFKVFNDDDVEFCVEAPTLAERIYGRNVRATMTFSAQEAREIQKLLKLAESAPKSSGRPAQAKKRHRSLCESTPCRGSGRDRIC